MNIWTKDNIINYTSDPDEVNDKKYPKELQVARKALREEDEAAKMMVELSIGIIY